jgi:MoaA/NifB/PqqE/SkfB family radical SAM enzyme
MNYDVEVDWLINEYCNFNCEYCFDSSDKLIKYKGDLNTQRIVDAFNKKGMNFLIHISGGEPLFFPYFVELCSELTKNHFISLNTNLSHKNIYGFGERINPQRVRFIHCSLHIQERERLKLVHDFIAKYNYLKDKGFYVFASYVMHPSLISRFKKDYDYFKSEGVILQPKAFRGSTYIWNETNYRIINKIRNKFSKLYPDSYTRKQKKLILKYDKDSENDEKANMSIEEIGIRKDISLDNFLEKYITKGLPSFKGKICLAGKSFVKIYSNGDVQRCNTETDYLGNLFDDQLNLYKNPIPCKSDYCTCPYFGYKYVKGEDK